MKFKYGLHRALHYRAIYVFLIELQHWNELQLNEDQFQLNQLWFMCLTALIEFNQHNFLFVINAKANRWLIWSSENSIQFRRNAQIESLSKVAAKRGRINEITVDEQIEQKHQTSKNKRKRRCVS